MEEQEKKDLEDIEYYSNSVNAWFTTRLEGTKSILVISAGALGLLITLLISFGVNNKTETILYFASILCFLIAVICMIFVFFRNAKFLSDLNSGKEENDKILDAAHKIGLGSFSLAMILAFLIGCSILFNTNPNNKEEIMSNSDKKNNVKTEKQFNNAQSMRPNRNPAQSQNNQNQSSRNDSTSTNRNSSSDGK